MSLAAPLPRLDARPLIAVSIALIGFALLLPASPARAAESSVFGDVVVKPGMYEDGASTVFGDVRVRAPVDGDVHSAFGDVRVAAPVKGNVNAGFGDVAVLQPVGGEVDAGFGDVYANSVVRDGIDVDHGDVHLGPQAVLMEPPRVGGGEFSSEDGARVYGGPMGAGMMPDFASSEDDLFGVLGWLVGAAGFAACAVLAAVVVPRALTASARRAEEAPGRSLLVGLVSLPAVLVLSVALAVSVIGVPLLLLIAPVYLALVFFGALVAAFFVGRKVMMATGRYRSGNAMAAAIGALLVAVTVLIPLVGELLLFALVLLGAGASILALAARRRPRRPAYPSYEAFVQDQKDA